jgi:polar amino acid transport system substrate-binding protein
MNLRRRSGLLRSAVLFTVVLGLGAASCGNDDDDASSDTTAAPATEAVATETTAAATTETTAAVTETAAAAVELKTVDAGKLTVCSDIPYAPFEFEKDGEIVGVDVDLVKAMATQVGLEATFVDTDFDGIFAALAAGSCDIIASSVSITPERQEKYDFTQGYFSINQSILVRVADKDTLNDLPALKDKTVAVQSETTGAAFVKDNAAANGYTVKEFTGADEMFTALKAEQVDAVIQDFPINSYQATNGGGDTAVSKVFTGGTEQYGFVVPKENPDLTAALDGALDKLRADGSYDKILTTYLGATGQ